MAANKTTYLEDRMVNHFLRATASTAPSTVYLALFSVAPGEASGGTELAVANNYAREAVTFGAPSDGVVTNSGAVTFTATGSAWLEILGYAIMDASTAGNMFYFEVVSGDTLADGDSLNFASGQISVTET